MGTLVLLLATLLPHADRVGEEVIVVYAPQKHILRVDAKGKGRVKIEGLVSFDNEEPVHILDATTPFKVKRDARRLCARFRSLEPERHIQVSLRKPSELRFGPVARASGPIVEIAWANAGLGVRYLDRPDSWRTELLCGTTGQGTSKE